MATERQQVLLQLLPMVTAADVRSMGPVGQIDADAIAPDLAESFTGFPDADADGEPDQSTPVSSTS